MKLYFVIFSLLFTSTLSHAQSFDETQKIVAPNRTLSEEFGRSLDISGDYAVIGSAYEDSINPANNNLVLTQTGAAYIYKKDTLGNWIEQQKLVASDRSTADLFGYDVAIYGDIAVIGAINTTDSIAHQAGAAYIFKRNSTTGTWDQIQKIQGSARDDLDDFGWSVSVHGSRIVIGDPAHESLNPYVPNNPGAIYIFEEDTSGNWQEVAQLFASDIDQGQLFGWSVDIDDNQIITGAYGEIRDSSGLSPLSAAGAAYLLERDSLGNWAETQKIVNSDRAAFNKFGYSVGMTDSLLIVGAIGNQFDEQGLDSTYDAGAAYVFHKGSSGIWLEKQKIVALHRHSYAAFGNAVDITTQFALIGVQEEDSNAVASAYFNSAGAAYLFKQDTLGDWNHEKKLVASDQDDADFFGSDVKLSAGTAMIGAYGEDLDMPFNNFAGAVYFFSCERITTNAVTICANDSLLIGTSWQNTAGVYYDTILLSDNCDSIIITNLAVLNAHFIQLTDSICHGDSLLFAGEYRTTTGVFTDSIQNQSGCDSIIQLDLTVLNVDFVFQTDSICMGDSLLFAGEYRTTTGIFTDSVQNQSGCDSIIKLDLTVLNVDFVTVTDSMCQGDSLLFAGSYITTSGVFIDSAQNQNGCDSVTQLNLSVVDLNYPLILSGDSILIGGAFNGTIEWWDCQTNSIIANEANYYFIPNQTGSYAAILTSGSCVDTTACIDFILGAIDIGIKGAVKIFPNPVNNILTIKFEGDYAHRINTISIFNVVGQEVYQQSTGSTSTLQIDISDQPAGVYTIQFTGQGNNLFYQTLIIQ